MRCRFDCSGQFQFLENGKECFSSVGHPKRGVSGGACKDLGMLSPEKKSEMASRILAGARAGERDIGALKSAATPWLIAA